MSKIILKTNDPGKTASIFEVLETEEKRLQYSLSLAKKRLKKFEKKYNVSSDLNNPSESSE